jgi:hypothetical protein
MVIVKVNQETASQLRNGNCYAVVGKKKTPALLYIEADDYTIVDAIEEFKANKNVGVVEHMGTHNKLSSLSSEIFRGAYTILTHELSTVTEEEVEKAVASTPAGVACMCKLPDDFCDMRFIRAMCDKFLNLRFCGGYLFRLDGCRLGYIAKDTLSDAINVKTDKLIATNSGCIMNYVDYEAVSLELKAPTKSKSKATNASKASKSTKATSTSSTKAQKPKQKTPKQIMGSLLGQGGLVDL